MLPLMDKSTSKRLSVSALEVHGVGFNAAPELADFWFISPSEMIAYCGVANKFCPRMSMGQLML